MKLVGLTLTSGILRKKQSTVKDIHEMRDGDPIVEPGTGAQVSGQPIPLHTYVRSIRLLLTH